MAIRTHRLGAWRDETVQAHVTVNDANSNVQSFTVNNRSGSPMTFQVYLLADLDPNTGVPLRSMLVTVLPNAAGQPSVYTNIPSGTKFSAVEVPEGDPRATNFAYSTVS